MISRNGFTNSFFLLNTEIQTQMFNKKHFFKNIEKERNLEKVFISVIIDYLPINDKYIVTTLDQSFGTCVVRK